MLQHLCRLAALTLLTFFLLGRSTSGAEPGTPFLQPVFGPHGPTIVIPEPPPLLRFSGTLKPVTPRAGSGLRQFAVTIGKTEWEFQLDNVEALSGSYRGSLVLSRVFPRQLRFVGPTKLLRQIENAAHAEQFVVVEGHLYVGTYKLRVTGVGDAEGGMEH